MGIEGVGLIPSESAIDRSHDRFTVLVCRGADMLASAEQAIRSSSGGRARVVDDVLASLPVSRVIHHGQEVLGSACREAIDGKVGKETARVIAGSVAEEITRGLVVTGTVLGVGGAIASGGGVLAVGCVGAAGYFLLPGVARRGAEALIERLGGAAQSLGAILRGRLESLVFIGFPPDILSFGKHAPSFEKADNGPFRRVAPAAFASASAAARAIPGRASPSTN